MRHHDQSEDAATDILTRGVISDLIAAASDPRKGSHREDTSTPSPLAERIDTALRATRALAFPRPQARAPHRKQTTDDPSGELDARTAEDELLREALRVLQRLTLPAVSAALLPTGTPLWRILGEPGDAEAREIELGDLRDQRIYEPTVASPSRHAGLWRALAPWRATQPEIGRLVLLPVQSGEQFSALVALGFPEPTGADHSWLSVAGAVATACAAGLAALRLRQRLASESNARDTYISLAAHELRSPITTIKGYAQLLTRQARKTPLPEPMQQSVDSIEQQSARMAEMVGELLDASRIRQGSLDMLLRQTDLVGVVRKAVNRREAFHPQHTFLVEAEADSLIGAWDAARVEQVLRDLLDNAARHSPSGGVVAICIAREGAFASVTVRDEGIGVAEEDRERIFEYLYRSPISMQRNLAGLGLGLFVSRHIIERHGGRLTLSTTRTTDPTGSEFQFTLPMA